MNEVKLEIKGVPVVLILGVALVLSGIYYLFLESLSFKLEYQPATIMISYAILFVLGIWLIINRDIDGHRCIYLCGMALGVAAILQNSFFMNDDDFGFIFFIGFLSVLLGIAEMAFSVAYLFGYRRYVVKLCLVPACQMLMIIIPIFFDWYATTPWNTILTNYYTTLPIMFVNVVFMWILTRKGIWVPFPIKRIEYNLEALEPVLHSDKGMYMVPDSLELLLDRERWSSCDIGPVEKETTIELVGDDRPVKMMVQLLKDDPVPHGRIIPCDGGQFAQGLYFDMIQMIVSEVRDSIRIYGTDGMFINIQVKEPPVEKKGLRTRIYPDAPEEGAVDETPV